MNILYFAPIMWDALKQRPQHLAEELSKYHRIQYIEPTVSLIKSKLDGSGLSKSRRIYVNQNLEVIRFDGTYKLPNSLKPMDLFGINDLYEKRIILKYIMDNDIVWLGSPMYYELVKNSMGTKPLVYDKMDDYISITNNRLLKLVVRKNERQVLRRSDIVLTSSTQMYQEMIDLNLLNVILINNGVDLNFANNNDIHRAIHDKITELKKGNRVIFGYIGTIDRWFDFEAIMKILQYDSDFHVILVGVNNLARVSHPRIHYIDPVDKVYLASLVKLFDYCLYPFKMNDFLKTIDPVKVYEYLSLNKRVIAVKSPETARFNSLISLYDNYLGFDYILSNLEDLRMPFLSDLELTKFVSENSWESRVKIISQKLCKL